MAEKLHAACDECRTRKLKCSGDAPACSRCDRENLTCVYSPQKPMGRPRKRRREDAQSDEAPASQLELGPVVDNFIVPPFDHGHMLSHTSLTTAFSGLEGVPVETLPSTCMIPPPSIDNFGVEPDYTSGQAMDPIDPLLWEPPPNDSASGSSSQAASSLGQPHTGPCSCLSLMYLALSDLQSVNDFAFPAVIPRIRPALSTASTMIHCTKCPTEAFSAIQNVQSLNALLSAIAERFHKVLAGIDAEAIRLEQNQERKPLRVGDNSPENMHLHTGSPHCPMSYELRLEAQDWKRLAKQMLKTEVLGEGRNPSSLLGSLDELEKRQHRWHQDKAMQTEERAQLFGAGSMCRDKGEDALCLKMIGHVRIMVEQMNWD